jgi:hypothetical protein
MAGFEVTTEGLGRQVRGGVWVIVEERGDHWYFKFTSGGLGAPKTEFDPDVLAAQKRPCALLLSEN